MYAAVTQ